MPDYDKNKEHNDQDFEGDEELPFFIIQKPYIENIIINFIITDNENCDNNNLSINLFSTLDDYYDEEEEYYDDEDEQVSENANQHDEDDGTRCGGEKETGTHKQKEDEKEMSELKEKMSSKKTSNNDNNKEKSPKQRKINKIKKPFEKFSLINSTNSIFNEVDLLFGRVREQIFCDYPYYVSDKNKTVYLKSANEKILTFSFDFFVSLLDNEEKGDGATQDIYVLFLLLCDYDIYMKRFINNAGKKQVEESINLYFHSISPHNREIFYGYLIYTLGNDSVYCQEKTIMGLIEENLLDPYILSKNKYIEKNENIMNILTKGEML